MMMSGLDKCGTEDRLTKARADIQGSSEIEPSPRSVAGLLAKARERSAEMAKGVETQRTQEHIDLIKALAVGYAHSGYNAQSTVSGAINAAERLMQTFAELRGER